jgi:hypothetical protein
MNRLLLHPCCAVSSGHTIAHLLFEGAGHAGLNLATFCALQRHNARVAARPHVVAARKAEGLE